MTYKWNDGFTNLRKVFGKHSRFKIISKISILFDGKTDPFDEPPKKKNKIETNDIVNFKYVVTNSVNVE